MYIDYDQFEPGIMASISDYQCLIEMYNNGDIYAQLAVLLFGTNQKRKLAKILFLSYMYGMRRDKLLWVIERLAGAQSKEEACSFFNRFNALEKWKSKLFESVKEDGYASSKMGNSRYIHNKGELTRDEERWIPSQVVQGTASLIFKLSIIKLQKDADFVRFLIPMHDGILIQVPIGQCILAQKMVENTFCGVFRDLCPQINARISFESFDKG